ncbi:hypothetical protein EPN27_00265 [Patescibacteria group bacterium]|nr:MAG: hypothetical protein EPN27_00265 [Patescibacteria group bacterium]
MKKIIYAILGGVVLIPSIASACIEDFGIRYGMMGGYHDGGFSTFMVIGCIVWTVVGILAGVWIWQNINKK